MIHGVLRTALNQALRWALVQRNVCTLADAPKRATGEMRALSPDEARRFLAAVQGDRLEVLYVLAATTGLRLGELQALRWKDVDFEQATLRVTATLQGVKAGVPIFGEPKTAKSRRVVRLALVALDALRKHRVVQDAEIIIMQEQGKNHGLVFTNLLGHPIDGNNLRVRSFAKLIRDAGLPAMRFHDLRHTFATLLMASGVPSKVASEALGHSDIMTTLRI